MRRGYPFAHSLPLSLYLYISPCVYYFIREHFFFCWTSVNKRVPFIFKYIPHSSFECVSDNKFCFVLMNERDLEREREFTKGNNFYIWNGNSDDNIFFKFFMHSCSNDNISKGIQNNNKNNNNAERKLWFSMGKTLMRNIVGKKMWHNKTCIHHCTVKKKLSENLCSLRSPLTWSPAFQLRAEFNLVCIFIGILSALPIRHFTTLSH